MALLGLGALAIHPLFRGRLVFGHDALPYPSRLAEMMRALADGHVPPVWAPDFGNGFGQPLFEFAPPLLYVLAAVPRAGGASLANALQLTLVTLFLAGAGAVYRIARRSRAPRDAAVATAVIWLLSPYVALDLFVRAAFAESAALALFPLALLALLRALDAPSRRRLAAAGVTVALLPLAHFPAAMLMLPALAAIAFAAAWSDGRVARGTLTASVAISTGLLLSAFSWLPALVEKEHVKIELLRQELLSWRLHSVAPRQLLWSPWGHGISVEGTGDGMPFMIGPLHVLAALGGLALALRSERRRERFDAAAFALVAIGAAWLSTTWSTFLWERLPLLQYMAFPWRALMLPSLFCSLLALPLLRRLPPGGRVAVLGAMLLVNLPHVVPRGFYSYSDDRYAPAVIARTGAPATMREEYEPRWVTRRPPYDPQRLRSHGGSIDLIAQEVRSNRQRFLVGTASGVRLEANTFYYPGWRVTVDGQPVATGVVPDRGTMWFDLPAGTHTVELRLEPTPVRRWAWWASVLAAVLLAALLITRGSRSPESERDPGAP